MSPDRAIFFDIDDTLIAIKSMFRFQHYYFSHAPEHAGADPDRLMNGFRETLADAAKGKSRETLNRAFYRSFAGRSVATVERLAQDWFDTLPASVWIAPAVALLERKRAEGYAVVGVSGSSHEILRGVRARLRLDGLLAARLERRDDRFTGELLPPQTIGAGKAVAIRNFAAVSGIDLDRSAACGDHLSDLAMLELVAERHVVAGDLHMEQVARKRGWPVMPRETAPDAEAHV